MRRPILILVFGAMALLVSGCDPCCHAQSVVVMEEYDKRLHDLEIRVADLESRVAKEETSKPYDGEMQTSPVPVVPRRIHYPLRNRYWTGCDNWRHMTEGPHRGKFDPTWLKSLSKAELQSLHADDHEGKVNWNYAVRGSRKTTSFIPIGTINQNGCVWNGIQWVCPKQFRN